MKITIEIKQDAQGYQIDARWGDGERQGGRGGTRFAPDLAGAEEKAHAFLTRAIRAEREAVVGSVLRDGVTHYLAPVQSLATHRQRTLELTYGRLVALLGEPNTTELENCSKVTASWAFRDDRGRTGFVWAYETDPETCTRWSASELGAGGLLTDLFGPEK